MKQHIPILQVLILLVSLLMGLSQTALDPARFQGTWYDTEDGSPYIFEDGVIRREDLGIVLSDGQVLSGAYTFCRDRIAVFYIDSRGLEQVQELYLVPGPQGDTLCQNPDGSGLVRFRREP